MVRRVRTPYGIDLGGLIGVSDGWAGGWEVPDMFPAPSVRKSEQDSRTVPGPLPEPAQPVDLGRTPNQVEL